jgi:hypothetical protein
MNMTGVVAELVVGGLQSLIWLTFVAMTIFGPTQVAGVLEKNSSLSAVFLVALSYALGVVFDRVWDSLLEITGVDALIRKGAKTETEGDRVRAKIFGSDPKNAVAFVEYNRSRMRVARASFFNFLLITITAYVLIAIHCGCGVTKEGLGVICGGSVLCVAAAWAYCNLRRTYDRVLRVAANAFPEHVLRS